MNRHIDRDALYDAVWAEPATTVAARYGITSTMLAKVCHKLRVPTPPRGYWAKKAAGQRVVPARLPKLERGQPTSHTFSQGAQPSAAEPDAVVAERARGSIVVGSDVATLHPTVRKYEARLRRRGELSDIWSGAECLAIDVSKQQLDRALRIMSALLGALDERGIAVEVTRPARDTDRGTTIALVDGQQLYIGLIEERRREAPAAEPDPTQRDLDAWKRVGDPRKRAEAYATTILAARSRAAPTAPKPAREVWTGQLRLWMSPIERSWHSWGQLQFSDTATHRLEDRLHKFVIQLRVVAEKIREQHARDLLLAEQRAQEARLRAQQEREQAREQRLLGDLADRIATLEEVAEIRALADAISMEQSTSPSTASWLAWARNRADVLEHVALDVTHAWESA